MKKALHLIHYDKTFLNIVIRLFEKNENLKNTFLVEDPHDSCNINKPNVLCKNLKEILNKNYLKTLNNYDIIIIHKLSKLWAKVIRKISSNSTIIWNAWGADFYQIHPKLNAMMYDSRTKHLLSKLANFKNRRFKPIIDFIFPYRTTFFLQKKIIRKINYIAPVIYDDYELIKKYYKAKHLKYIEFSYGTLEEDFISGIKSGTTLGNNILLGNSSWFSNNHVEAIDLLENIDLGIRKIITPLSYGDDKLKQYLIQYGAKKLNNNFEPLIDFFDRDNYYTKILSCGFLIINSYRQQALGNIITMLYLGAKVFFNKKNPTYSYYKRLGAFVFLIDEIIIKKEGAFTSLTNEEIAKNREVIVKTRSKNHVDGLIIKISEL